jgi:hypothetical protein
MTGLRRFTAILATPSRDVPTPVIVISVCTLILTLFLAVSGALMVGATWDEYGLARFLQSYLDSGWFTEPTAIANGVPDLGQIWYLNSYGPVGSLPGHLIAMASGVDSLDSVSLSANAFAVRHLGSVAWAIVGVASVALAARLVLRSWTWAVLAAAVLSSVPLWVGHGMFNPKDIPVAAAYSLAMLAATAMCVAQPGGTTVRRRLLIATLLAVALVAAAGTRPFAGIMIALSVVGALMFRLLWSWWARLPTRRLWTPFLDVAGASIAAYVILLAIYPRLFSDPIALGVGAYLEARQFAFNEYLITAGQWLSQPAPPWYLPVWFAAQLPLLVFIGSLVGVVAWLARLLRRPEPGDPSGPREVLGLMPWVIQAFGALTLAIVGGAVVYNGSRQYLFAVPAFALLATFAIASVARWGARRQFDRRFAVAYWVVVSVGLLVPVIGQVQLHPYSYVYYNAVTTAVAPIDGAWPTDYWRAGARELWSLVPADGDEGCAYEQGLWGRRAPCSKEQMFIPYQAERGLNARAVATMPDSIWLIRENQGVVDPPAGCRIADEIARRNLWQSVTIGQVLECSKDVPLESFAYPPPGK